MTQIRVRVIEVQEGFRGTSEILVPAPALAYLGWSEGDVLRMEYPPTGGILLIREGK